MTTTTAPRRRADDLAGFAQASHRYHQARTHKASHVVEAERVVAELADPSFVAGLAAVGVHDPQDWLAVSEAFRETTRETMK